MKNWFLRKGVPVALAEKGQDEKHDNDQADDVNDAVHRGFLRVNGMGGGAALKRRRPATPPYRLRCSCSVR